MTASLDGVCVTFTTYTLKMIGFAFNKFSSRILVIHLHSSSVAYVGAVSISFISTVTLLMVRYFSCEAGLSELRPVQSASPVSLHALVVSAYLWAAPRCIVFDHAPGSCALIT